ncbi:hypothetical protein CDD81_3472 [Ophiocordyceps australis]|uniref:Zn(2)-C6 fungal-type domain-containing protein n=1 Tax=Ophiocordyceps australis TaxID=1399860 RepID=A0A2C5YDM1_9HYPO|nr:hypothetical protein CDD81_3472 [Ophiocordyceps australis]
MPAKSEPSSTLRAPAQRARGWKRRIAKACDACRRKRTKCSGTRPICAQCVAVGAECHYSDHDRKPGSRLAKSRQAKQLEQRVHRLETSLQQTGLGRESSGEGDWESQSTEGAAPELDRRGSKGVDNTDMLVVEDSGDVRYFGPSASMAIFSPAGLQWLECRTADSTLRQRLQPVLANTGSWAQWQHPLLQHLSPTMPASALPSWEEASGLVHEYLDLVMTSLPLFHPPTLVSLLEQQYTAGRREALPIERPAWTVALFSIMALAKRRRAEEAGGEEGRRLHDEAWTFINLALNNVMAVVMRSGGLLSIQALLALACFFHGTPNPQPFFFLTAVAVRLCHSIGMHRAAGPASASPVEREQRLRVFWIAFYLDSLTALNTGRPCSQTVNDIGVPLPSGSPRDNLGIMVNLNGHAMFNALQIRCRLALLRTLTYEAIFTASASGKSNEAMSKDIDGFVKQLEELGRLIPGATEESVSLEGWGRYTPCLVKILFEYYGCVITTSSAMWKREFYKRPSSTRDIHLPYFEKCKQSSLEMIRLLNYVPPHLTAFQWEATPRAYRAMIVVFCCIILQPGHAEVDRYLQAVEKATDFIARTLALEPKSYVQAAHIIARELIRVSRAVMAKARARATAQCNPQPGHAQAPFTAPFAAATTTHANLDASAMAPNDLLPMDDWGANGSQIMPGAFLTDFLGLSNEASAMDQWLGMSFTFPWDLPDLQSRTHQNPDFTY